MTPQPFQYFFALVLCLAVHPVIAQVPVPASPQSPVLPAIKAPVDPAIEHIVVEDTGARIDELRVGGETKSINVQPKGNMPAYQIAPKTGERTWKVLGF